jgi:uncharacterized membrane protein YkvA (DUF1232 family)
VPGGSGAGTLAREHWCAEETPIMPEYLRLTDVRGWKRRARELKRLVRTLALAARDPRTPWRAKVVIACVVAYAASPIDLVPDIIPILGYLDDLILLPLGVALAIRLIPRTVWNDALQRADEPWRPTRAGAVMAIVIVVLWIVAIIAVWKLVQYWR